MTKDEIVGQLYEAQSKLQKNLAQVLATTADPAEHELVITRFNSLRDAYFQALYADLVDFNATVSHLYGELKDEAEQLTVELDGEKNAVAVIGLVTEIIKLAGGIVVAAL